MKLAIIFSIFLLSLQAFASSIYEVAFFEAGALYHNGKGIDKDIIEELSKRTTIQFIHTEKPRARIWTEMLDGRLAVTMTGLPTPEREKAAWFYTYAVQRNQAIFLKKKTKSYSSFEDFSKDIDARMAVVRGFKHGDYYDKIINEMKNTKRVDEVAEMDTLFMMLKKNERIDLILSSPFFYIPHLKEFHLENKVIIKNWDKGLHPNPACVVLSKKLVSETDRKKIEIALDEMKKDGTIKKILLRYVPEKDANAALSY